MGKHHNKSVVAPEVRSATRELAEQRIAEVAKIHNVEDHAPPSIPPEPRVRWIVPRGYGRPIAHAYLEGSSRTLCGGIPVNGAVTPPADELERCADCRARETSHE